jgi:SAM-dependent methyltransferase
MSVRIRLSRGLIRLANGIKFLSLVVMKPEDLIAVTRNFYARPDQVAAWSDPGLVESGLSEDEIDLLARLPIRTGRLLLLGVGGGREAITLSKEGYEVVGVDFVPEMVAQTQATAQKHDVEIEGLVQDVSTLEVPSGSFDVIWFSRLLYSSIPSSSRRIAMMKRVHQALRPEGCAVCQFNWDALPAFSSPLARRAQSLIDRLGLALRQFEQGDYLKFDAEFNHSFMSEQELRSEFDAAGFSVQHLDLRKGAAILVKG